MQIKIDTPIKHVDSMLFQEESGLSLFIENGAWFIGGTDDEEIALAALANHNPIIPTEPTLNDKLASVGLSIEELKAALGGN
jgi:hypothetical protein